MKTIQTLIIGGGSGGIAAAIEAYKINKEVLLVEREDQLGGILKQCIHDGFGLTYFKEKLTGPEYISRFLDEFYKLGIPYKVLTFVTDIKEVKNGYIVTFVNTEGVTKILTKTIIFATGCRERSAKQVFIMGSRPSGVLTSGAAQYYTNILNQKITNKCVILGSGDIGLIMARRLTLEGSKVLGVYEIKNSPSGLQRNIQQCLIDYKIPLHLSTTVTKIFGKERVEGIEIAKVDDKLNVIEGTQERIDCDALILSVGLIPENELAEGIKVKIDNKTKGPVVDGQYMTNKKGVFACGNCMHVNDLVDFVSYSGQIAGANAARFENIDTKYVDVEASPLMGYLLPQHINVNANNSKVMFYFRSKDVINNPKLEVYVDDRLVLSRSYLVIRPPEMETITLDLSNLSTNSKITFKLIKGE